MVWSALHARLHQRLKATPLLPHGERVLMAVSGGQDSLCLGRLLLDLRSRWGWQLAIAHCDHGWSTDAGLATHVAQVANLWQLPFYLSTATTAIAETENTARQWRYQALSDVAQQYHYPVLVTGHTQSDRAETFLYNLTRGAGMAGLGSLTWRRSLTPTVSLIRPLLEISRQETGQFCQQFNLPIWVDPFNEQPKFARNRLRHDILPQLQQLNPQVESHLAQTAELLHTENDYLEAIAQQHLAAVTNADQHLNRPQLQTLHPALQKRIIRQLLQRLLPQMPTFAQINAVQALITAPNRSQTSTFPGNCYFYVEQNWIICRYHNEVL